MNLRYHFRGLKSFSEAEEINRQVLSEKIKTAGPQALTTLLTFNNLAIDLYDQIKCLEAEDLIQKVVD